MKEDSVQIVVLGAGYAGMMSAFRLAGKLKGKSVTVTLVNADECFVERPKLHEVATGQSPIQRPIVDMLAGTSIRFIHGWAEAIDPNAQTVTVATSSGTETLDYEYLVYALGSHGRVDTVPHMETYAYTLDSAGPRSASQLFESLAGLAAGGRVVVVGSGPTGIEVASEIADRYPEHAVTMVTRSAFASFTSNKVNRYMRAAMDRLGVDLREESEVTVVADNHIVLNNEEHLDYDILVWAGGFAAGPLAAHAGLPVNDKNQLVVDRTLRSVKYPTILAVGDTAALTQQPGAPARMSLFFALISGAHAADNIVRMWGGRPPEPLGFSTYGQGIALGRRDAVGFNTFPSDTPVGPLVTGRSGLAVRNFFVWLILKLLYVEKRRPGFFFWLGRNRGQADFVPAAEATLSREMVSG